MDEFHSPSQGYAAPDGSPPLGETPRRTIPRHRFRSASLERPLVLSTSTEYGSPIVPRPVSPRAELTLDELYLIRARDAKLFSAGLLRAMEAYLVERRAAMEGCQLASIGDELLDARLLEQARSQPLILPPTRGGKRRPSDDLQQEAAKRALLEPSPSPTPPQPRGLDMPRLSPEPLATSYAAAASAYAPMPTALATVANQSAANARPPRPIPHTHGVQAAPAPPVAKLVAPASAPPAAPPAVARRPPPAAPPAVPASAPPAASPTAGAPPPPGAPATGVAVTKPPSKPRYPPIVVETLPNWVHHFREIQQRLKRVPNARPYQKGVRFSPADDEEYRCVQSYLSTLEKTTGVHWYSYSLPAERSLKIAIRGLPANTEPAEITSALAERGYEASFVKQIRARKGRPGCIFHAQLKKTPGITASLYDTDELLFMPGVKIEAWRGKKGPAQCHRCQKFRHSSHNCHRPQACVRCGGPHPAADCDRPREMPPTCANCGGPHTANNTSCPVFRQESRNKKAGPAARTGGPKTQPPPPKPPTVQESAPSSLMAEANPATAPGAPLPKRKRKRGGKKNEVPRAAEEKGAAAPPPPPENEPPRDLVAALIKALQDPAVLRSIAEHLP